MKTRLYSRWVGALVIAMFAALLLVYLLPVAVMLLSSLKDQKETLFFNPFELPKNFFNFENYKKAWTSLSYPRAALNSLIVTSLSVFFTVMLSALAGYAIARGTKRRFGRLYMFFVMGLLIPYQAVFTPMYLVGSKLGFVNNFLGLVFLYTASQLPFGVFMMTGFMRNISKQIEEAASIDGCNTLQIFFYIVLPLLKPAIITLAVLRALLVWNDYLLASSFLTSKDKQTLTAGFASLFGQYQSDFATAFASVVFSALPIIVFFIFNQRTIEKGIAGGAVKG